MTETPIKPWHRLRNWFLAGTLLLVVTVAWMVVETRKVQHAQANLAVDYREQFRKYVERHVDLGPDNGAEAWRAMIEMLNQTEEVLLQFTQELEAHDDFQPRFEHDVPSPDFDYVSHGPHIPADADRERLAIEQVRQRGVLEKFARFVELSPGYNPDHGSDLFTELLPWLRRAREMTWVRVASMRFAQADGDYNEVAEAFEQVMAMGHTLALQPGLIHSLVAQAIHSMVSQELRHQLAESHFDVTTSLSLLDSLERFELPHAWHVLEGERAGIHDFVQTHFSDDGRGSGYLLANIGYLQFGTPTSNLSFPAAFTSRFLLSNRREALRYFDKAFDGMVSEAEKPREERGQEFDVDTFVDELSWRHLLVGIMLPATARFVEADMLNRSEYTATRIMVAIALHRAQHGAYPASLDSLVPDILPEPPVDPLHGGPYGYRLLDDDEHGRPYLLYSFGLDGTDDGGKEPVHHKNPKAAMVLEEEGRGFDYVFNRPREAWVPD